MVKIRNLLTGTIDTYFIGGEGAVRSVNSKTGAVVLDANDVEAVPITEKGAANGVAELDAQGKVPVSQLPSYVDNVVEGYYNTADGKFYTDPAHTTAITPESHKVYLSKDTNKTYRWSGTSYVIIGSDLALGETASTAYRGDRGKTAYDHSQLTSGNPHGVTKNDVGLGDVGNFKAVSTVASQPLTATEKENARNNIGAGTPITVVDNLTTDTATDALSAKQGKVLKTLVDTKPNVIVQTTDPGEGVDIDPNTLLIVV
jgi:hypothetical protein